MQHLIYQMGLINLLNGRKTMSLPTAIIITTVLIIIATLLPTYIISKKKTTTNEEWAIASHELPIYVVIGTQFASIVGGGYMVAHVGNAYSVGIGHLTYGLLSVLPLIAIMLLAKWLRKNSFSTIPDIIKHYTGGHNRAINILCGVATMLFPFGWITSQITAFASIYTQVTGLDYTLLCCLFSAVALFFVMPSGLKTVAWTDFIFACFMCVLMLIIAIAATIMAGGGAAISAAVEPSMLSVGDSLKAIGANTIILWFFSILPGGMTNQIYYQRVCAIDNEKKVNSSLIISAVVAFVAFCWSVYMGITIKAINPGLEVASNATGWLMTQLPMPIVACFCGALFAAMMSTVSSGVQSIVVNITRDIVPELKPDISDEQSLRLSRIMSFVLVAFSLIMCLFFTDTLTWLVATAGLSASMMLCPIFVSYLLRKKHIITNAGIAAGIIFGAAGGILGMALNTTVNYAVLGIVFSLAGMLLVSALTKKSSQIISAE